MADRLPASFYKRLILFDYALRPNCVLKVCASPSVSLEGFFSMATTSSHTVFDDDDRDFDWEAAVKEIDSACLSSKPSTSASINYPPHIINKPLTTSRQSTLDDFVRKSVPIENNIERNEELGRVQVDPEAAKTWIYPVNIPLRDYQLSITRTALFSNTLVALPTGLGKTLIAAVVMFNYFRWFPKGKIVFAAPSRPLVMQQIEACHNIVGIPQEWAIDMTGQVNPSTRMLLWKAKRVFFVTPQVLENDIRSGTCLARYLVCLVIDEAHRASGNYAYCVALRELMNMSIQLRVLALTATPGSKHQTIQQVIDNLQISTLEYRTESDTDVRPYVHDRNIELVEVAMGPDAVELDKMLMEIARPFVARLSTMGVIPNRDFKTLSPIDLLNNARDKFRQVYLIVNILQSSIVVAVPKNTHHLSPIDLLNARDKFRQAPPLDLPQLKYGEVEGLLGVLITLYHILKLLSSHGIKPAYEMLVDKLKQGPFARLMSRNESLDKVKLLMHQSLSHGAPSPKLSKMLEVLIDHFKSKDPSKSRVIIFSNFRGSVRDIMDALSKIGEYVKATQFIGQSSGKTLRGQSQKAQQAVLEKFRAGGYNVIVATSIGEEGLDIMEVDLVICFDANISPLRMIQRMGRTGRKSDGRVVVLACEGSELKGYKRKQASSNTIKKHLCNGGMNSFRFHASPRMIPHMFKPEVKLVELSIKQFVHRGKKMKDDNPSESPSYTAKLTDEESNLIAMYFGPSKESSSWRPSLIAFPHFQAFPSRVHGVMHSVGTGMLIDAMQSLQGLSFTKDIGASIKEDEDMPNLDLEVTTTLQQENCIKVASGLWISHDSPEERVSEEAPISDPLVTENPATVDKNHIPSCCDQDPLVHSYLFSSDIVSVDSVGIVMVLPVPLLPVKELPNVECVNQDSAQLESSFMETKDFSMVNHISDPITDSPTKCTQTENGVSFLSADYPSNDFNDVELSPQLTNFIQSGFVPESPVDCAGTPSCKERQNWMEPDHRSPCISNIGASFKSFPIPVQTDKLESKMHLQGSVSNKVQSPVLNNIKCNVARTSVVFSPMIQSPLADSFSDECSKEWCSSSGVVQRSVQQERKFKRLRKYGDDQRLRYSEGEGDKTGPKLNKSRALARSSPLVVENGVGKMKRASGARTFIEMEAEVSSEVEVSNDEDVQEINSSYEDSFIDDKINPTASTSVQAETSTIDMMAIYRRSLLSQSPMEGLPSGCTDHTPDSFAPSSRTSDSATPSGETHHPLSTPHCVPETESIHKILSESIPCRESGIHKESKNEVWKRKLKLSFNQVPAVNLEKQFSAQGDAVCREPCDQIDQVHRIEANGNVFEDDEDKFYEGIDLDALEEQAAKLLEDKLKAASPKQIIFSPSNVPLMDLAGSPSFDLGI